VLESDSHKGRQSPPNTRKSYSGVRQRHSQYRCDSDRKECRPWPKKSNSGYETDTASEGATSDESEELKSAYAQATSGLPAKKIHPLALYAYST
jgi:hypothetical protein